MSVAPSLLPDERQRVIRERLAAHGRVLAADLARELGTSEDTLRRDLRELAKLGLCRRVYGGALPISPVSGPFERRRAEAPERKQGLARVAASLVAPGQLIFLDAGSTNLAIARALPDAADLTVATNTPAIALELMGRTGITVVLLGGVLAAQEGATLGAHALRQAQEISPDLCFLGACALDAGDGIRSFGFEDAEFKRALVATSRAIAVVAISEKLGTTAPYYVATAAAIDHLVVESDAAGETLAAFERQGTRIHRAPA